MKKSGILLFLLICLPAGAPSKMMAQADENTDELIVISKAPSQVPVAVPDFLPKYSGPSARELSVKLAQILREDLDATGLFQIIPQELHLQSLPVSEDKEDYKAWAMIGAEAVVRGIFELRGEDLYQIELRFYDVTANRMVLGKRYTGSVKSLRRMIHRFADEILNWLTGERGCFETRIAFVSDHTGRREIYTMDSDGEDVQPVTENRTLNLSPEWLDPENIFFTSYKKVQPQLFLKNISDGQEMQVTQKTRFNLGAAVSQQGKRVALAIQGTGGNIDIYLMNADGSDIRRVTTNEAIDISPAWSPDSRFMAFVSDRTGSPQIHMLNIMAGAESPRNPSVRISWKGDYNTSPEFSPDGKRVVYSGQVKGQFDLFLINLGQEGEKAVTRLTETAWNEEDPAWSPDGRMIVYSSNQKGDYDIHTISLFGGKTRRLTDSPSYEGAPKWSPSLRTSSP